MAISRATNPSAPERFRPWAASADDVLRSLESRDTGLTREQVQSRRSEGGNSEAVRRAQPLAIFLRQFKSPLVLILVFAAAVSLATRDWVDAGIVLAIVLASAVLSFQQEYRRCG